MALQESVLRTAADAGVEHVVYLSFVSPDPDAGFPAGRWHHETEGSLRALLPGRWTAVRSAVYQQALLTSAGVVADGVLHAPVGAGRIAPVDRRDLAPVIARILLEGSHRGRALDVTGPRLVDWTAVAEAQGLRYADADPTWTGGALREGGVAEPFVEAVLGLFADVRADRHEVVLDAVSEVGGVLPRELGDTGGGIDLVRAFVDAVDAHDHSAAGAVVAEDYVQHDPGVEPGRAGLVAGTATFLDAASDLVADLVSVVPAGDVVAATIRWTTRGTSWLTHDVWRHAGGLPVEHWDDVDLGALYRRLQPAA